MSPPLPHRSTSRRSSVVIPIPSESEPESEEGGQRRDHRPGEPDFGNRQDLVGHERPDSERHDEPADDVDAEEQRRAANRCDLDVVDGLLASI